MRSLRVLIVLVLTACLAGTLALPAGASAASKTCKPKTSKRCKALLRKKKKKAAPKPPGAKIAVDFLEGSYADVAIPALPLPGGQVIIGTGATERVPLAGRLNGQLPGPLQLGKDISVTLTGGSLSLGAVDVLKDPSCSNNPTLRINPASVVTLDPAATTKALLKQNGTSTASAAVRLRLAFDSRTALDCAAPLVPTGYTDTPLALTLSGTVGPAGLVGLELVSASTPLTVGVCLTPGDPTKPCTDGPAGYPVKITVHIKVAIRILS